MPASDDSNSVINMRVTANSIQGHRKYMEDCYKIRFQRESSLMNSQNTALLNAANSAGYFAKNKLSDSPDSQSDIIFSYFGIFDGHGGKEASQFAKEKLYWRIVEQEDFWSEDHSKVLNAIREGFIQCHMDMWNELGSWPKTASGLPSTSGSTATVMFIRKSKAYVGHVGDSGLLIGYSKNQAGSNKNNLWQARKLTRDHKPEDPIELKRIEQMGGSVAVKSGVNRVVWNRPILNPNKHRSTNSQTNNLVNSNSVSYDLSHYKSRPIQIQTERIPFLAVARSLGDLWSYDINRDEFIVSPVPDVFHFDIDPTIHKCLILATDGLWNVVRANECVEMVRQTDKETEKLASETNKIDLLDSTAATVQPFVNPSQRLVNTAMQRCCEKMIRADNTTCITIMIDQPPSYEDYLTNSNETIIRGTNLTTLDINKTFDKTGILNMSDDYDDDIDPDEEKSEIFGDDLSDYAVSRMRRERKRKSTNKTFNQTTSTEITEFNTPLNNDKRSRSLISIRRRRWSASSNRSTAGVSSQTSNHREKSRSRTNNKFVNVENREQRMASTNNINGHYMNKSSSSNAINQNRNSRNTNRSNTHLANNIDIEYYQASNYIENELESESRNIEMIRKKRTSALTLRLREVPGTYNHRKSLLNVSTVSVGINKISKNFRKSCNDLYTLAKSSKQKQKDTNVDDPLASSEVDGKENVEKLPTDNNGYDSKSSKYSKRLKKLKDRLIKTKNSLFHRKSKHQASGDGSENAPENNNSFRNQSKHQSMPNLSKIELDDSPSCGDIEYIDKNFELSGQDSDECEDSYAEIDLNFKKLNTSQSFVNNVKSRLVNNMKRKNGLSKKNLESTELPDCTNTVDTLATRKQSKRIKFF